MNIIYLAITPRLGQLNPTACLRFFAAFLILYNARCEFIKDQRNFSRRASTVFLGKQRSKVKVKVSSVKRVALPARRREPTDGGKRRSGNGAASTLLPAVATRKRNFLSSWRFHAASAFSLPSGSATLWIVQCLPRVADFHGFYGDFGELATVYRQSRGIRRWFPRMNNGWTSSRGSTRRLALAASIFRGVSIPFAGLPWFNSFVILSAWLRQNVIASDGLRVWQGKVRIDPSTTNDDVQISLESRTY